MFRELCSKYASIMKTAKCNHHKLEIENCDDRALFRFVNRMSSVRSENPDRETPEALASDFREYFDSKIRQIIMVLDESGYHLCLPKYKIEWIREPIKKFA